MPIDVGKPKRCSSGPGHAPAPQFDKHPPTRSHPVAITEPDPLAIIGGQLQVSCECRHPNGEHHHTTRLRPGLQPAYSTGTESADLLTDHDDIEPVDHRRQHLDPQRVTGDHHQPLQRHADVGRGTHTHVGNAGNADPGSLTRRRRSQRQGQRHPGSTGARNGGTTLKGRQQLDEGLVHR